MSFHEGPKCLDKGPKCLFQKGPKCPIGAKAVGAEVVGAEVSKIRIEYIKRQWSHGLCHVYVLGLNLVLELS